jgi:hypothetical protein
LDVIHSHSQDFHGFLDRGLRRVVAGVKTEAPLSGWQKDQSPAKGPVTDYIPPVGTGHIETEHDPQAADVLNQFGIPRLQLIEGCPRPGPGLANLVQVKAVHHSHEANHPHRISFPGGVEFLLLLEEDRQGFIYKKYSVLRLFGPGHNVGGRREVEVLVGPQFPGDPETCLNLVEDEWNIINLGEDPKALEKSCTRQADAALSLDRFDDNPRNPQGVSEGFGAESFSLGGDKIGHVTRAGKEGVDPGQFIRERHAGARPL